MTYYTLVFVFNSDMDRVALIKKKLKPAHHVGLYNGLGGHVEPGETHSKCARREVLEESSLEITDLKLFATMGTNTKPEYSRDLSFEWSCDCYRAYSEFELGQIHDTKEGTVDGILVSDVLNIPAINNLSWLVLMAKDLDNDRRTVRIPYGN